MRHLLAATFTAALLAAPQATAQNVPIDYYKLDNGLKVVLSQDKTAPVVAVGIYYDIGFRIEGTDPRTGNPTGTLVVRVDGEWVEIMSAGRVRLLK